jgi:two-component system, cell cycle response regulator CtrA
MANARETSDKTIEEAIIAMNIEARLEMLERENAALRERIAQLMEPCMTAASLMPIEFRLTTHEAEVLAHLMTKQQTTKENLMNALYGLSPDGGPQAKIIDVFICKLRKKLKPFDIEIETIWGQGYLLTENSKAIIRQMTSASVAA